MRNLFRLFQTHRSAILLTVLCLVALLLASKGITDEGAVSLNGDMPRYLMNGVYFYDLIADGIPADLIRHTYNYFAQYPALSLGHHPVLLPIAEVPFFALFGISVASGRATIIAFLLLAVVYWFLLARSVYDDRVAFFSSLLFLSSPPVVMYSRIVMSEIPAFSLVIVAAYYFHRFVKSEQRKYLVVFVIVFTLSCYAKQLAIFALPAFVLHLAFRRGFRSLFSIAVILAFLIVGVLLVPLVLMTLWYSPTNVGYTAGLQGDYGVSLWASHFFYPIQAIWTYQLLPVAVLLSAIGILGSVIKRDKRAVFFLLWIGSLYGLVVFIGLHQARLTIYWIPVFGLFAALSPDLFRNKTARAVVLALLVVVVGYQLVSAQALEMDHAAGYEEAARYVIDGAKGPTIMYSSVADTGYFVFFVRKWDPGRELIILRANKIYATSLYRGFLEERISRAEEIYKALDDFGVCYVVLEDVDSQSAALNMLREEVKQESFVLRHEIPILTEDSRLQGVSLQVFEYTRCGPPNPDATLDMNLPLIGDSISVKLRDLLK